MKCWGNNSRGAVGLGEPDGRGYLPNQMGANLPALGLPPTAQISAVEDHVCATSIAGEVRCWGENSNGELGYGDKKRRGLVSSALPRVVLE